MSAIRSLLASVLPGRPGRPAAAVAALLAGGTVLKAGGGAAFVPEELADLLLAVIRWFGLVAVAATVGAVVGHAASHAAAAPLSRREVSPGAAWTLGAAATLAGAVLRFAPEGLLPFRLWIDTLFYARPALRQPGAVPWIGGTWFGDDAPLGRLVAPYGWAAWADAVFSQLGSGETGLVALSALPSVAAILAGGWLAAELGGREAALGAAVVLSLAGWPIVHGRWGYTSVALVPLALGGGAALLRAARLRSLAWAAGGGALAGATLLTYPAAWPFLAALTPSLAAAWRRPAQRRLLVAAVAGLLAALLLVVPAWLGHPERLGGRAHEVWIGASAKDAAIPGEAGLGGLPVRIAYNVWEYVSLLAGNPDPNPRHFLPGRAPVPAFLGALALVGAATLAREVAPRRWIFGGLVAGSLLAGVAASPAAVPNTQRVATFVMLMLVLAGRALAALPRSREGVLAAVGLAGIVLAATDGRVLLGQWVSDPRVESAFLPAETEAGRLLARLARAPIVVVKGSVAFPLAVETLASAGARPILPPRRIEPEELTRSPGNEAAFWVVARRQDLARVEPGRLRVGRGVAPSGLTPDVVVARAARAGP